ncbi:hypothetical protein [Nostoc sp. MG11]|uniref:hypothetical protein n=1 Tax=Nostoc sp. MG11 TaxID=2721166 RepID=UPI001867B015|nr:hypothetical protein [Nostoc sp. MG11]
MESIRAYDAAKVSEDEAIPFRVRHKRLAFCGASRFTMIEKARSQGDSNSRESQWGNAKTQ